MNIATVYCDGAYSRLVQKAGYGVVVELNGKITEFFEPVTCTPSSLLAEMLGAIRAIEVFGPKCDLIKIYSDSKHLTDGMNTNLKKWADNKWIDRHNKPIVNKDLWWRLFSLVKRFHIEWNWVRGHNGDTANERADELAKLAIWGQ